MTLLFVRRSVGLLLLGAFLALIPGTIGTEHVPLLRNAVYVPESDSTRAGTILFFLLWQFSTFATAILLLCDRHDYRPAVAGIACYLMFIIVAQHGLAAWGLPRIWTEPFSWDRTLLAQKYSSMFGPILLLASIFIPYRKEAT